MFGSLKKLFGGEEKEEKIIAAPVNGTAIPMSRVSDPTFSQEILGKGTAVIPSDGRVVAPADGLVTMVFDTKHAISMQTDNGAELIIHIGLDTVALNGRGFASKLKVGTPVKKGMEIVRFDRELILGQGYNPMTMMIFTNTNGHTMKFVTEGNARKGRSVVAVF